MLSASLTSVAAGASTLARVRGRGLEASAPVCGIIGDRESGARSLHESDAKRALELRGGAPLTSHAGNVWRSDRRRLLTMDLDEAARS